MKRIGVETGHGSHIMTMHFSKDLNTLALSLFFLTSQRMHVVEFYETLPLLLLLVFKSSKRNLCERKWAV